MNRPTTKRRAKPRAVRVVAPMTAFADVGSHGGIFMFAGGPVADLYPNLLHIYAKDAPGLVPVRIVPLPKGGRKHGK